MFKVIRRVIIIFAVLLAVLAVDLLQCGTGVVPTITVAEKSGDTLELQMTYVLPMGGYSAHNVAADEVEHTSNGFVLYIGSDSPIHIEEIESTKLDGILGMIKIPIEIG